VQAMLCPRCMRPMTTLFTSSVCDWCDGLKKPTIVARGWVLLNGPLDSRGRELDVFPSLEMVDYYRFATGLEGEIREIASETPIQWSDAGGLVPHLCVAERRFRVFPDFKFEPGPYKAFLAPAPADAPAVDASTTDII
jgi:hypothetical protein